jgi:hypothetical protein
MARSRTPSRRGGRTRGPELRGTLGTLLRTTLAQAGAVREVLERGAREGKARFDVARSERRRDQALADLGGLVLELIERGEAPELAEHPDVAAAIDAIVELDAAEAGRDDRDRDDRGSRRPVAGRDYVPSSRRESFDARRTTPARPREREREPERDDDGGAVSSRSWRPPSPASPGSAGVWRPPAAAAGRDPDAEPGARFRDRTGEHGGAGIRPREVETEVPTRPMRPMARPTAPDAPAGPPPPRPRGGIQFNDADDETEADLADYMHPDDVPAGDKK